MPADTKANLIWVRITSTGSALVTLLGRRHGTPVTEPTQAGRWYSGELLLPTNQTLRIEYYPDARTRPLSMSIVLLHSILCIRDYQHTDFNPFLNHSFFLDWDEL